MSLLARLYTQQRCLSSCSSNVIRSTLMMIGHGSYGDAYSTPTLRRTALFFSSQQSSEDSLSPEALQRLATLSKLRLDEQDIPKLCRDVGNVLKYVERIQQIDTTGILSRKTFYRLTIVIIVLIHTIIFHSSSSGIEPLVSPLVEVTQTPLREDVPSPTNSEENAKVLSNAKSKTGIFLAVPKIKEVF